MGWGDCATKWGRRQPIMRRRGAALAEQGQCSLHFVAGVHVAGFLGDDDAVGQEFPRFLGAAEAPEELAKLEIAGDVVRMRFEEFLEMLGSRGIVAEFHTFERESVAGEGVGRFFSDELLEHFAARLLCLGHTLEARIIPAEEARA